MTKALSLIHTYIDDGIATAALLQYCSQIYYCIVPVYYKEQIQNAHHYKQASRSRFRVPAFEMMSSEEIENGELQAAAFATSVLESQMLQSTEVIKQCWGEGCHLP